jgi:16S rRNA (cytosine1402-N4)-methyltransferase
MNAATPLPEPAPGADAAAFYHRPVLVAETLWALAPAPGRVIVDGTLGGGGHTRALLGAGADVIGLDRDAAAIDHCRKQFAGQTPASGRLT